jgi:hypothetical protein
VTSLGESRKSQARLASAKTTQSPTASETTVVTAAPV